MDGDDDGFMHDEDEVDSEVSLAHTVDVNVWFHKLDHIQNMLPRLRICGMLTNITWSHCATCPQGLHASTFPGVHSGHWQCRA